MSSGDFAGLDIQHSSLPHLAPLQVAPLSSPVAWPSWAAAQASKSKDVGAAGPLVG